MIDLATAPRAHIYTTWGTVLFVDADTGELRHGPIDTSPENAVFVADPTSKEPRRQGWLMQVAGEKLEPIACGALSCRAVDAADVGDPPAAGTMLELMPRERGLIAFRAESQFLCAQPDGRVDLSKPWCSTWECFLASEGWCSTAPTGDGAQAPIDWKNIRKMLIDPRLRMKANADSTATKLLIYGYPYWSHGRVYHDICKYLHRKGYIVDIINWQVNHADYIGELKSFYDFFISALDGVGTLADVYGVPHEQIIAISHHEMDMRALIDQKGVEIFDKFAGYCVVGYQLFDASAIFGIKREPMVVQLGVDFSEFYAEIPERLATVGYASSFSQKTIHGVEIKRGQLAEAAAREAGLGFKVAGSTADQTSIHDMPEFYRSVDAVLVSSVTEGAQLPIREAAAAGRLVISTPVGDFPLRAYQGTGIVAPIESEKYRKFASAQLQYYKDNPEAFVDVCRKTQDAARQLDWEYMIDDWVQLIETAQGHVLELARSHQQAGRFADAARVFAKRADCGGDEEEKWYARWQHARCLRDLRDEDGFVQTALQAFRERPHRAEPLHDLANYYLDTQRAGPAAFYAEAALAIPKPAQDRLFVDPSLYDFGLRHTFAVAASWSDDPDLKERGRTVCDWLALDRRVPRHIREPARYNSGWFAVPAQSLMPSLRFRALNVKAPDGFHPSNVSICRYGDGFIAIVRTVNWILKDGFWYVLQGTPPYRSHLLFLELDEELSLIGTTDLLPPEDMPVPENCESGLHHDLGFADPRPFIWHDELWCISIVRQLNEQSLSEMVLSRIEMSHPGRYIITDWRVVPSGMPARHEKNWMPQVVGDELRLIYTVDPIRILSDSGAVLHNEPAPIDAESFRGGSQAVAFDEGWLMVIHEVEHVNGRRRYFHRFIWMVAAKGVRRLSRRFYLREAGVEFVAGIAWHPDGKNLALSFSTNDRDPCLAVVSADEVRAMLLDIALHEQANLKVHTSAREQLHKPIFSSGAGDNASNGTCASDGGAPLATKDKDRAAVSSAKLLVIYHYFERNDFYKDNLLYFISNGLLDKNDYIFVINGSCSVVIPTRQNIKWINRENIGFDFGGYEEAINNFPEILNYDYFLFLNCTVCGPFLPADCGHDWSDLFINMLSTDIKLAGSTINILHGNSRYSTKFRENYAFNEPYSHVQSMIFAMDRECILFLMKNNFFNRGNENNHDDVIVHHEILMSQLVLNNGWNITCLLPEYAQLNYRTVTDDINPSSASGDPWVVDGYFGRSIHPFETIFFKTNREIRDLTALEYIAEDPRTVVGRTIAGDVLEIGPGHDPFPAVPGSRVRYADRSIEGGRDKNFPELAGSPHGPKADFNINVDADGLAGIPDCSVDVVIACHVIEHLANPIAALREFERVLRYHGRLVLVVPDRNVTFDSVRQPTPLSVVLGKFHQRVTQVSDAEIREFCSAIYFQPPIHPPSVREWHNPQHLDAALFNLHRRRSIHVHCWSPEEFAALIAGTLHSGLVSWKLSTLYFPDYRRPIEFGLVLERTASTGPEASDQFVRDWTSVTLSTPAHNARRIAMFASALRRDSAPSERHDSAVTLAEAVMPFKNGEAVITTCRRGRRRRYIKVPHGG